MAEDKEPIPLGFGDPEVIKAWKVNYAKMREKLPQDWHGVFEWNSETFDAPAYSATNSNCATSDVTAEDLKASMVLIREALKHPEGYIDVLLMTNQQWERLKEQIVTKSPEQRDVVVPAWIFAGLPVETYPTKAEVDARAKVLRAEGKAVGMVEETDNLS